MRSADEDSQRIKRIKNRHWSLAIGDLVIWKIFTGNDGNNSHNS